MIKILFTISIILIVSACGNEPDIIVEDGDILQSNFVDTCNCRDLSIDSLGIYSDNTGKYTGVCIGYYPNSKSKYVEKNLLAGLLHGSVIYYGKTGDILIEEIYKEGISKRTSTAENLNCNCNELTQKKSSDPSTPIKYSLDDIPFTGTCQSYYPDAKQVYMEAIYENGFLEGRSTFYDQGGKMLYTEVYKQGYLEKTIH